MHMCTKQYISWWRSSRPGKPGVNVSVAGGVQDASIKRGTNLLNHLRHSICMHEQNTTLLDGGPSGPGKPGVKASVAGGVQDASICTRPKFKKNWSTLYVHVHKTIYLLMAVQWARKTQSKCQCCRRCPGRLYQAWDKFIKSFEALRMHVWTKHYIAWWQSSRPGKFGVEASVAGGVQDASIGTRPELKKHWSTLYARVHKILYFLMTVQRARKTQLKGQCCRRHSGCLYQAWDKIIKSFKALCMHACTKHYIAWWRSSELGRPGVKASVGGGVQDASICKRPELKKNWSTLYACMHKTLYFLMAV